MNSISNEVKQIISLSSQFMQGKEFLYICAGVLGVFAIALIVIFLLLSKRRRSTGRDVSKEERDYSESDTEELPDLRMYVGVQGFSVEEDITFIHTDEKI